MGEFTQYNNTLIYKWCKDGKVHGVSVKLNGYVGACKELLRGCTNGPNAD